MERAPPRLHAVEAVGREAHASAQRICESVSHRAEDMVDEAREEAAGCARRDRRDESMGAMHARCACADTWRTAEREDADEKSA